MKRTIKTIVFPLLAALIWGIAFVAQSVSADFVGAFTFNAARSTVAAVVLALGLWVYGRFRKRKAAPPSQSVDPACRKKARKALLLGGLCCGAVLFIASNLQQLGMSDTAAGKAGFITSLYIVIVPILGIFLHKRVTPGQWISVLIAVIGLYFLCIRGTITIAASDFFIFLSAVMFAVHILVIDRATQGVDPVQLSCVQFCTVAVLSWIAALIWEHPTWAQLEPCLLEILYVGVFSSGVAYTLQIIAQKDANPVTLSLLLSLESVFSTLSGAVLLQERLAGQEYLGCALMLIAVVLAQLPEKKKRKTEP